MISKPLKKLKCFILGHKVGKKLLLKRDLHFCSTWKIKCSDCGYTLKYDSPLCRLIGIEMRYGFKRNL